MNEYGTLSSSPRLTGLITIYRDHNSADLMVSIAHDGTITYGPNYTPDEAAKIFWNAISVNAPGNDR